MCTLSWRPTNNGYVMMFNRDEQRSRKLASPPARKQHNQVHFLAPTDAERGGTWMLVNAHGLSVCLLNHYPETPPPAIEKAQSRGNLVLDFADCTDVAGVMKRIAPMPLMAYPPFQLVAMDMMGGAELTWNGRARTTSALDTKGVMLSSSSYRPAATVCARNEMFNRIIGDISTATNGQQDALHRQRDDDPAASIRMSRPDACTHSIARIITSGRNAGQEAIANFYYEPQPEMTPAGPPVDISLKLVAPQARC